MEDAFNFESTQLGNEKKKWKVGYFCKLTLGPSPTDAMQ